MQQRSVIVSAVVIAMILAGFLWYTLTRDTTPRDVTVLPSPLVSTSTPTANDIISEAETTPLPTPTPTPEPQDVAATAPTGTTQIVLLGSTLLTSAGLYGLRRVTYLN